VAGRPFLIAVAFYAAGRLFVDAYRENASVVFGGYHVMQIVSLVALVVALVMLARNASAGADNQLVN
jgi:prolipoprotein diacylglyceryltransferase